MSAKPTIGQVMTPFPWTISRTENVRSAIALMQLKQIRHLPVVDGSDIFGILTDRDIKLTLAVTAPGVGPESIQAGEICVDTPYVVTPDTLLHEVLSEMASRRIGSALVQENGSLVGIFTTYDACVHFSQLLSARA